MTFFSNVEQRCSLMENILKYITSLVSGSFFYSFVSYSRCPTFFRGNFDVNIRFAQVYTKPIEISRNCATSQLIGTNRESDDCKTLQT